MAPTTDRAPHPDPLAWPRTLEARTAAERWAERHPAVVVVHEVVASAPLAGPDLVRALAEAGEHAAATGARRMDLRLPADHPAVGWLALDGWMVGRTDASSATAEIVASRSLTLPWAPPVQALPAWAERLPPRVRRTLRRARSLDVAQLPRLGRDLAREGMGHLQERRRPPAVESTPRAGAPVGAHPFAATRFATIDEALDRVAPDLRRGVLLDVGAGDGRVLRRALDRGLGGAVGRELDADLAQRARSIAPDARVEVGDALAAPLPDDVSVVYLNNPFEAPVVEQLADRIAEALERRPRPLAVLYVNPPAIASLVAAGLVAVDQTPRLTVLVTRQR